MSSKIDLSLDTQRKQLEDFIRQHAYLGEAILQLKGSIAALEYVKTLNLVEPDDRTPSS